MRNCNRYPEGISSTMEGLMKITSRTGDGNGSITLEMEKVADMGAARLFAQMLSGLLTLTGIMSTVNFEAAAWWIYLSACAALYTFGRSRFNSLCSFRCCGYFDGKYRWISRPDEEELVEQLMSLVLNGPGVETAMRD
jgi:hypothetical protein